MSGKADKDSKGTTASRRASGRKSRRTAGRRSETRAGRSYQHLADETNWVARSRRRSGAFPWEKSPGAVLLVGCAMLLICFLTHPVFRVGAIFVRGQKLAGMDEIASASGMEGRSIFQVNPSQAQEQILAGCPSIEYADVSNSLPNNVTIEVKERNIATVWETGGERFLVDETGLILTRGEIVGQSVLIQDQDGLQRQPGDRVSLDILSMVWKLNRSMPDVNRFLYSEVHGVSILTPQGWPVYFGTKGDPAFKVGLLKALIADFGTRGIHPKYVDLRLDQRPAYR